MTDLAATGFKAATGVSTISKRARTICRCVLKHVL